MGKQQSPRILRIFSGASLIFIRSFQLGSSSSCISSLFMAMACMTVAFNQYAHRLADMPPQQDAARCILLLFSPLLPKDKRTMRDVECRSQRPGSMHIEFHTFVLAPATQHAGLAFPFAFTFHNGDCILGTTLMPIWLFFGEKDSKLSFPFSILDLEVVKENNHIFETFIKNITYN